VIWSFYARLDGLSPVLLLINGPTNMNCRRLSNALTTPEAVSVKSLVSQKAICD
jgi:hypothetical protein